MGKAVVLAGVGARGACKIGMLQELVGQQAVDFDILRGVSVGALNASFLGQASKARKSLRNLQKQLDQLTYIWTTEIQGNLSVYGERPGGFVGLATGAESLYSLEPLKRHALPIRIKVGLRDVPRRGEAPGVGPQLRGGDGVPRLRQPGMRPRPTDADTTKAVETVLGAPPPGAEDTPRSIKPYAKALILKGELSKADEVLQGLVARRPKDVDALLLKAQALLADNRPLEAVPFLETLATLPTAPLLTWKLLGYAYLFDPERLDESMKATQRYLQSEPGDPGARLNLACVYGQRGPLDDEAKQRLPELLGAVLAASPGLKTRVQQLTGPGQDFEAWRGEPAIQRLIA